MKIFKLFFILAVLSLMTDCTKDLITDTPDNNLNELKSAKPHLKIAVMSDIHYLDPTLLVNGAASGEAFQNYLNFDPKLIEFSDPILKAAISEVVAAKPDILLIPGDLTKDGEKVSHETVAGLLKNVANQGIKVFVIPGNHDINNPEAKAYDGNNSTTTATISTDEFASIYNNFGYKNAISKDANSLSYVCQPFNNVWILGIDDCKYTQNAGSPITSGLIKDETMVWIQDRLAEAKKKNITVLALMHHGIVEHYTGQNQIDPGYVTDNWEVNADALIDAGLRVMFTGHYHANDITMRSKDGNTLFDIETGSLVTPPSPFHIITMDPNYMYLGTEFITSIDATLPYNLDFVPYSNMFLAGHLNGIFSSLLPARFGVNQDDVATLAPLCSNAFMAHYAGDENAPASDLVTIGNYADTYPQLAGTLMSLWKDLQPSDNQFKVDIRKKLR